jgi:hypothetical protein
MSENGVLEQARRPAGVTCPRCKENRLKLLPQGICAICVRADPAPARPARRGRRTCTKCGKHPRAPGTTVQGNGDLLHTALPYSGGEPCNGLVTIEDAPAQAPRAPKAARTSRGSRRKAKGRKRRVAGPSKPARAAQVPPHLPGGSGLVVVELLVLTDGGKADLEELQEALGHSAQDVRVLQQRAVQLQAVGR